MHKKCNRAFPSCDRCLSKGIRCVYGKPLKKGRPRKTPIPTSPPKGSIISKQNKTKTRDFLEQKILKQIEQQQSPEMFNLLLLSTIVGQ